MKITLTESVSPHCLSARFGEFVYQIELPVFCGELQAGRDGHYSARGEARWEEKGSPAKLEVSGPIPNAAVRGILQTIGELKIPAIMPFPHQLDAGAGSLRIEDAGATVSISWTGSSSQIEVLRGVFDAFEAFSRLYPLQPRPLNQKEDDSALFEVLRQVEEEERARQARNSRN
jgi:hypothetical protein